jgi:hypothetical protein
VKLAAYIPTESPMGAVDEYERAVVLSTAKRMFAECYGGYTVTGAVGGWMGENGLVEEAVSILYTFTDEPNLHQLRTIGRMICSRLNQEAAAIEHGGEMEFVTSPDMKVEVR